MKRQQQQLKPSQGWLPLSKPDIRKSSWNQKQKKHTLQNKTQKKEKKKDNDNSLLLRQKELESNLSRGEEEETEAT
jgi:hypothetical protein